MIVQLNFTLLGILSAVVTGFVYYLVWEAGGWWLLASVAGLGFIKYYFTMKAAHASVSQTIGTLAAECQNLALHINKLAKINKELKQQLGVKDNP